jgi:archaellum component FlaG (FlaF/FlaG flagellin family)
MNNKKLIIIIVIFTLLSIAGVVLAISKMTAQPAVNKTANAKISVAQTNHDWGEIKMNDGNVTKTFTIANTGSETLELFNVKTSCTCTTAIFKDGDKTSPTFGMHTTSNYIQTVEPGQSTQLEVIYDPAFHGPNGIGAITRQVTLETNDLSSPQLTFNLKALVTN